MKNKKLFYVILLIIIINIKFEILLSQEELKSKRIDLDTKDSVEEFIGSVSIVDTSSSSQAGIRLFPPFY